MDSSELVCGRPFGDCSILYWNSLASCITPRDSCLNRFCGVKFNCSTGLPMLFVCIYMPSSSSPSYFTECLNTLGELDGFIHSYHSDVVVIVVDFNVDFDHCCQICYVTLCVIIVCVPVIYCLKMMCCLHTSVMMVSVVYGLIMFFAPSLSQLPYQMYVLSILVLFFLTNFHCCSLWTIYLLIRLSLCPLPNCIVLTGLG